MNDRVSQVPPATYTGEEELRERFEKEEQLRGKKSASHRKYTHHSNGSIAGSTSNHSDTSRHSSIFRFGKSLAATFNLSNWKIFSKEQQEDEEASQLRILRERQEKAEKLYQELKRTGHFRDSHVPPVFSAAPEEKIAAAKHDSGVGMRRSSEETTRAEKRMGRVFFDPPVLQDHGSPVSNVGSAAPSSARRGSFHFKRPSLSNIRKGRDHGSDSASAAGDTDGLRQPRKIPSRKDLQNQQKLVKRVSGLELKLDAARRELAAALGGPAPEKKAQPRGRPRFVPGALSTLPSERLLSGYVSSEAEDGSTVAGEVYSNIGRAVTTEEHGMEIMAGAKGGSYELEGDAPSKKAKTLSKASSAEEDSLIPSIESEEGIEVGIELAESALEAGDEEAEDDEVSTISTPIPAKSESEYQHQSTKADSDESDYASHISSSLASPSSQPDSPVKKTTPRKSTPKRSIPKKSIPVANVPAPSQPRSKKRKNGDGSGIYRPPPASESSVTTVPPKKPAAKRPAARPNKLQKVSHEASSSKLIGASPTRSSSAAVSRNGSTKLTKPRSDKQKQKVAGSQVSSLSGVNKTRSRRGVEDGEEVVEPMYTAIPSKEGAVPPMPKLPRQVRLASGEVVSLGGSSGSGSKTLGDGDAVVGESGKGKRAVDMRIGTGMGAEPQKSKKAMQREDSFEWDQDVF